MTPVVFGGAIRLSSQLRVSRTTAALAARSSLSVAFDAARRTARRFRRSSATARVSAVARELAERFNSASTTDLRAARRSADSLGVEAFAFEYTDSIIVPITSSAEGAAGFRAWNAIMRSTRSGCNNPSAT